MANLNKFNIIIPPRDIAINKQCLLKIAGGDQQEFAWLYSNYSRKVYDFIMLMTQDESLSEDIVHDVFIRLWMHREKLANIENFNGYLYRLQKNLVIDSLKQRQMELSVREQYFRDSLRTSVNSFELFEYKEIKHSLEKAVRKIPQQRQIVFRLSKEDGWKRMKIASALKISPFTVKCHLQKAVKTLRMEASLNKY